MATSRAQSKNVLGKVLETRKAILRDRALLAVRLPSRSVDQHRRFRWFKPMVSDDRRFDEVL